MAANQDNSSNSRAVELLTRMLSESDIDALLAAFARGEISEERIVAELAVRYQRGIGSAVQSLAEHNKVAAKVLGERLRSRIDEFLAGLADRDVPASDKILRPTVSDGFKDRDDAVLLREYVILKSLAHRNEPVKSATIFEAVRKLGSDVQDEAITAHLSRMAKAGVIGRERKGRYNAVMQGAAHLVGLVSEIEARGLRLPVLPERIPE